MWIAGRRRGIDADALSRLKGSGRLVFWGRVRLQQLISLYLERKRPAARSKASR
jgi:hypothetical protein